MIDLKATIAAMKEADMDDASIVAALSCLRLETVTAPQLTARQLRNKRYYDAKASEKRLNSSEQDVSDAFPPPSPDKKSPQTPKELTPSAPASPARGEFDHFWALFPNKVGKADAVKAFSKARIRVDFQTMIDGLYRYVRKTDDRPWCNPSTWLNQDRWTDEPATQPRGSPPQRPKGMQGMFSEMREVLENGQADDGGSDGPARAPVLSLPYRRAG